MLAQQQASRLLRHTAACQAAAALLQLQQGLCTSASTPFLGEVPQAKVATGHPFWLDFDQERLPPEYQHSTSADHSPQSLPTLYAAFREQTGLPATGTWAARKLRGLGLTPALLDSLPHGQAPRQLVLAAGQASTAFARFGASLENQLFLLHLVQPSDLALFNQPAEDTMSHAQAHGLPQPQHTFQVLPRRLSVNPVRGNLLAVSLLNCPSTRIVESKVPVLPVNVDESPCARRGGFALVTQKLLRVRSAATNIPLEMPIDCSEFEPGAKVFARDIAVGKGRQLVGVDGGACILKMEFGGS